MSKIQQSKKKFLSNFTSFLIKENEIYTAPDVKELIAQMIRNINQIDEKVIPKRTLIIECRSCGDEGYYEDIKDDDNDYKYGTCYDCEERECDNCEAMSSIFKGMQEDDENKEFWCDECYYTVAKTQFNHN